MQSLVAVQQVLVSDQPKLAVLSGGAMKFMLFFICMLGHLAMDIGTQQAKLFLSRSCWTKPVWQQHHRPKPLLSGNTKWFPTAGFQLDAGLGWGNRRCFLRHGHHLGNAPSKVATKLDLSTLMVSGEP